jgi:DNA-binding transcriptional MerR regulator
MAMYPMRMTELAGRLGVEISTPRRWCTLFEQRGYAFGRDGSNRRIFQERDVLLLERFQHHCSSMKLDEALTLLFDERRGRVGPVLGQSSITGPDFKEIFRSMIKEVDGYLRDLPHEIYWYGAGVALRQCSERWDAFAADREAFWDKF